MISRRPLFALLAGDARSRRWTLAVAVAVPVVASVVFLAGVDRVLGFGLLYVALIAAAFAGWTRAGLAAGAATVGSAVLWRFVFPPLVGYLRDSMDARYVPPRFLDYKANPRAELVEGLTNGPPAAVAAAVVLGGAAYGVGAGLRRLLRKSAAERSSDGF